MNAEREIVASGVDGLDEVLQGLRMGDNVVWQVDGLGDYAHFARPFIGKAIAEGRRCVYLRFASHPPILAKTEGLEVIEASPARGFDAFVSDVFRIVQDEGREVFYVLDNLSDLVADWATDEQLANFFQVMCPYLYELDTVAYFALMRGQHDFSAIARVRDTTQVLIDVYRVNGELYIHPLKVYGRYSPTMHLPHYVSDSAVSPVLQSGEAAAVSSTARKSRVRVVANSIAPWESVYRKLIEYTESRSPVAEINSEAAALKQELSRMLFGVHPTFEGLADRYFDLDDLLDIRHRLIGSGRIGGKAAGMLVARRILQQGGAEVDFRQVLEDHDSFFIGSDVFFTFLVNNNLFRLRLELSRISSLTHEEFEEVERRFLAGSFPADIMEQFREMLAYFGQAPIIVRSSSLLEDSFGNAFAGKYLSEFCPNQASAEGRVQQFVRAVKLVYASTLNPDALSYRRRRGLTSSDEQMAILVQRVSGMPYKQYFFPSLAGVAFSRNLYAWNDRIDQKKGVIRLVFGLGTRAVNRVGGDYPRMISISHPELRPEVGSRVAKYSQFHADLIDLAGDEFVTRPVRELLAEHDYPDLEMFISLLTDGFVQDPASSLIDFTGREIVLTFNRLIQRTSFVKYMSEMLQRLEGAYGHPVDVEFTGSVRPDGNVRINLLQCRPMWLPGAAEVVEVPEGISASRTLFKTDRLMCGGVIRDIRYILYIGPRRYGALVDQDLKRSIGRMVGKINRHPAVEEGGIVMMGPGRWGSSNIALGVNVGYADIDNSAALVELACEEAGHVPEVSYGTHFFQDLVEAQIIYLPLYPDDEAACFNAAFFENSENVVTQMIPDAGALEDFIRLIDVPGATGGLSAQVIANAESGKAICFLK